MDRTAVSDPAGRLLWMAASVAALVYALRAEGLMHSLALAVAAGYCFKQAA